MMSDYSLSLRLYRLLCVGIAQCAVGGFDYRAVVNGEYAHVGKLIVCASLVNHGSLEGGDTRSIEHVNHLLHAYAVGYEFVAAAIQLNGQGVAVGAVACDEVAHLVYHLHLLVEHHGGAYLGRIYYTFALFVGLVGQF